MNFIDNYLVKQISGSTGSAGANILSEDNQIKAALENLEKEQEEFKIEHEAEIRTLIKKGWTSAQKIVNYLKNKYHKK